MSHDIHSFRLHQAFGSMGFGSQNLKSRPQSELCPIGDVDIAMARYERVAYPHYRDRPYKRVPIRAFNTLARGFFSAVCSRLNTQRSSGLLLSIFYHVHHTHKILREIDIRKRWGIVRTGG